MGSLAAEPHDVKLPTSPSTAPESPTTEVTKSARLIVNMKRELMELIKAEHYETALTVCDRLLALAPHDAMVSQYKEVLEEKIELAEIPMPKDGEVVGGEDEDDDDDEEEEESSEEEEEEEEESESEAESEADDDDDDDA